MRAFLYVLAAAALFATGWYVGRESSDPQRDLAERFGAEMRAHAEMRQRLSPKLERLGERLETQAVDMERLYAERRQAQAESERLGREVKALQTGYEKAALEASLARIRELVPGRYGSMTIEELRHLRELDLSTSGVMDDDLAMLASLPALRRLTLRRTRVTGAGFAQLASMELEYLDVELTAVTKKSVEELQAANPGIDVRSNWDK